MAILIWFVGSIIYEILFTKVGPGLLHNIKGLVIIAYNIIIKTKAFIIFEFMEALVFALVFWLAGYSSLSFKIRWDYIVGIFTVVIPLLDNEYHVGYLSLLKQSFKGLFVWSAVITFIINQYTFSLWIELILVPIVVIPSMCLVVAEYSNKINYKRKVILALNDFLAIIFIVVLCVDIHGLFMGMTKSKMMEFILEYLTPAFVFIINLPMLMIWRYVNMIDLPMQHFKHHHIYNYIGYLIRKFFYHLRIKLMKRINWNRVYIKMDVPYRYQIYIYRRVNHLELFLIIKAAETMAIPKKICKNYHQRCFPVRIDVYRTIKNHNKLIATWIEPRLANQNQFVSSTLKRESSGLYMSV